MTMPRSKLVDLEVTRYYHLISKCVRHAFLCGGDFEHRKKWIEDRLVVLCGCFGIHVCAFAVMDNHLHVLVRIDPEMAAAWSDEEVVRRWIMVYPPKTPKGELIHTTEAWIADKAKDQAEVAKMRGRLVNLGWFMKCLKEPLARQANKEDGVTGNFWASRYKSIAILDTEALLSTAAYIDLNPFAAGIGNTPEESPFTSLRQRVAHATSQGELEELRLAESQGSVAASQALGDFEQDHWLCPIDDRRRQGAAREGMLEGYSLGSYLLLVDYTSRLCREGKAHLDKGVASIFERLGTSAEIWNLRLQTMFAAGRKLFGSYFASSRARLQEVAAKRGVHHVDNLAACAAK